MIEESKEFASTLKALYESRRITVDLDYTFEDMMKSNETRLEFLNGLFDDVEMGNLSGECIELLDRSIDFIRAFINGEFKENIHVDKKFYEDESKCLIIPTQNDIQILYKIIEANLLLYKLYYKDNGYTIKLPEKSFNMNMTRVLNIDYHNLAHIFGLTQSEPEPDKKKNLLKKYYLEHFDNGEKVQDSVKLLNWFISDEGKKEIYRLNQLTLDFVAKDRVENPGSYDSNGNIKENAMDKFRKRFKEDPQNEGLDYPIIRFSRYICKCINNLNFLNMSNITQMILDYNAPKNEKDEKDIFLVNMDTSKLLKYVDGYYKIKEGLEEYFKRYGKNPSESKEIEEFMFSHLIEPNSNHIESKKEEIRSFLNLYQVYDFVGKHGIKPNTSEVENKLSKFLSKAFEANVSLIGFGTDFKKDENEEIVTTELDQSTINNSHCDTSIIITPVELTDKYYKRGRAFFIDKIASEPNDEEEREYARISIPQEEIDYIRIVDYYMHPQESKKRIKSLTELLNKFNGNFLKYKKNYPYGIEKENNKPVR